jgi:hypothetical protein
VSATLDLTAGPRAAPAVAQALDDHLGAFLSPILDRLEAVADNRLVRTFLATIRAILTFCVVATLGSLCDPDAVSPFGARVAMAGAACC